MAGPTERAPCVSEPGFPGELFRGTQDSQFDSTRPPTCEVTCGTADPSEVARLCFLFGITEGSEMLALGLCSSTFRLLLYRLEHSDDGWRSSSRPRP